MSQPPHSIAALMSQLPPTMAVRTSHPPAAVSAAVTPRCSPPQHQPSKMDRRWICGTLFSQDGTLFSQEYVNGVKEFTNFIQAKFREDEEILCPCRECRNHKYWHRVVVNKHILTNGMESTYTRWIYHGEDFNADVIEHLVDMHDSENGNNGAD